MTLLLSVLLASVAGSLHCVGMCGGLCAVASNADGRRQAVERGVSYHAARLLGYLALGAAAGSMGAGVEMGGELLGLQHAAALFSGAILMAWGLRLLVARAPMLLPRIGLRPRKPTLTERLGSWAAAASRLALRLPPVLRALALGVGSALLPCGWLWAFVLAAAATGSTVLGALSMLAFWLGTLPALLGWSWLLTQATRWLGPRLPRLLGVALLSLGAWNVLHRWPHAAQAAGTPAAEHRSAGSCH